MPFFEFRAVEAQQFTGRESISAVAELVRRFRPGATYFSDPKAGILRFTNSGPDVIVETGSWVVAIGADVIVMPQADFDVAVAQPVEEPGD